MSKKQKSFEVEKIVEWDDKWDEENLTDKHLLVIGLLFMIPIIGQIVWLVWLVCALYSRKVRYIAKEK